MKIYYLLLIATLGVLNINAQGLHAVYLRCEYKENPVTDAASPRLSWELTSAENNQLQSAYQILVASAPDLLTESKADLWNSGNVPGRATRQIDYKGKPLASRQICYWKVHSWDQNGRVGRWSNVAMWEMGLLSKNDWQAQWIGLDHLGKGKTYHLPPAPYLRTEIFVKKTTTKARLYVTALGLYEFSINGKKAGDAFLAPGWTDYDKRVYYQTYDVTESLKPGSANMLASQLSYGWYSGYLGYSFIGSKPGRSCILRQSHIYCKLTEFGETLVLLFG